MYVSYAAIALARHIVRNEPFPDDLSFVIASEELESAGHYTLLAACAEIQPIDWRYCEQSVELIDPVILSKYRIASRDWTGKMRYLKFIASQRFVSKGVEVNGYVVTGGKAPHKQGSTGHVWHNHGEFYPSVLNMEWV